MGVPVPAGDRGDRQRAGQVAGGDARDQGRTQVGDLVGAPSARRRSRPGCPSRPRTSWRPGPSTPGTAARPRPPPRPRPASPGRTGAGCRAGRRPPGRRRPPPGGPGSCRPATPPTRPRRGRGRRRRARRRPATRPPGTPRPGGTPGARGSPSRSWLHAIAARRLRCRPAGASWASSSRCRLCRRTASSPGSNCVNRAAATSSASGSPSSWRQIVTRWCRLAASRAKPGRTAAVRSSSTAIAGTAATRARSAGSGSGGRPWAGIASGGTAYSRSLATRTRSCEVASTLTRRAPVSTAVSAAPRPGTASQLSTTSSIVRSRSCPTSRSRVLATGPAAGPEPGRDQGDRRLRRAGAEQVDGDHTVREPVRDLARQRGGEARLAHTRRPGQRQQPAPGRQQGRAECRELVGTPQECGVDHASS